MSLGISKADFLELEKRVNHLEQRQLTKSDKQAMLENAEALKQRIDDSIYAVERKFDNNIYAVEHRLDDKVDEKMEKIVFAMSRVLNRKLAPIKEGIHQLQETVENMK